MMSTPDETTYTVFDGARRVVTGPLRAVVSILKERFDRDRSTSLLTFEDATARLVHFDLRGSLEEVLARVAAPAQRGPGRPRLGVMGREVNLLPQHWEWLEQQPNGISAALRRLVDRAMKAEPGKERARRMRAAVGQFLTMTGGDRPGYEEASRALYAGDVMRFEECLERWPKDLREYAVGRAREVERGR